MSKPKSTVQNYSKLFVIELFAVLIVISIAAALTPIIKPTTRLQAQQVPDYRIVNPAVLPPGLTRPTPSPSSDTPLDIESADAASVIFFESDRDGNWNIYRMDTAGNNQTRLNSDSSTEGVPRYSSAANKIVFESNRSGNYDIYVMNTAGSTSPTRLTTSADNEFWASWSPAGTQIAYTRETGGKREIYIMNADGSNQRRLTSNNQFSAFPTWSKDGSKIAFMRNTESTLQCNSGNWDIYVIGVNGSGQTKLTTNGYGDMYPVWSHANNKITYTGCEEESSGWSTSYVPHIWTMSATGSGQVKLTTEDDWASTWSEDGTKILFATARDGNDEVYAMNSSGSSLTNLTRRSSSNEEVSSWGNMGPPPIAQFSGKPLNGVAPLTVQFTNASTGEITAYSWSFGDGGTSISPNPLHTYAQAGKYTVSLTVTGPGGSDIETKVDYIEVQPPRPGLSYIGPLYDLKATALVEGAQRAVVLAEVDERITVGDHAHLRLYFKNTGNITLTNTTVQVMGKAEANSSPAVWIQNQQGSNWGTLQTIALTPATLAPGAVGWCDVWVYVDDIDPIARTSLYGETGFKVHTVSGDWTIQTSLLPIKFLASENRNLTAGSCLHNPDDFEIQSYAQYAAAKQGQSHTPDNDPDTAERTILNLTSCVKSEFKYGNGPSGYRIADMTLVGTRGGTIGECRHYADLTVGLLRSLDIPSRYVRASLGANWFEREGHAWAEAFVAESWTRVDTTWGQVGPIAAQVRWAKADKFPLASAANYDWNYLMCVPACYEYPINCEICIHDSNWCPVSNSGRCPSLINTYMGCVEDVTSSYQPLFSQMNLEATTPISISIQAPILVTHESPFTATTKVKNNSITSLETVTVTLSLKDYGDFAPLLFDASPSYQVAANLDSGEMITLTWTITPMVTGSGIPLLVEAMAGEAIETTGHKFVVSEPGTLPPLTIEGMCGLGTVHPGQALTLTTNVLDESLLPITDTYTTITATVYSTPTVGFSTVVNLTYCASCGHYQYTMNLPADAPLGSYQIDYVTARPGYTPARAKSAFFVAPELTVTLDVAPDPVFEMASMTFNASVYERGTKVDKAGVYAEITTPNGLVTIPLVLSGAVYSMTLHPADLVPNLGQAIEDGAWGVKVVADYYGSKATNQKSIVVIAARRVYLPLVLRAY